MSNFRTFENKSGYHDVFKLGETTKYTGLGLLNLEARETYSSITKGEEVVLVILSGKCHISVNSKVYENLGQRSDVFSGKATAVYVPRDSEYKITEAKGEKAEIAVASAPADERYESFVIKPEDIVVNHRGKQYYERDVHDIVVDNAEGKVNRIIVGETFSYSGQWSSYPSHKHDRYDPPYEANMEEIYHFKVKPSEGFGVQVLYNDDLSLRQAYMIKDGDSVAISEGYHPVVSAPGFKVYYLWIMAGNYGRKLIPRDDPKIEKFFK